jgi:hypothetical protein
MGTTKESNYSTIEKIGQPCAHVDLFGPKFLVYKSIWGLNIVH